MNNLLTTAITFILGSLFVTGIFANKSEHEYEIKMIDINLGNDFWQNGYVLFNKSTKDAIIIDPGKVDSQIENYISENKLKVQAIINTHGNRDHVGGNSHYKKLYGVKIYAHINEKPIFRNSKNVSFHSENNFPSIKGFKGLKVLHIPGHTPGSIAIYISDILITGDTLQKEGIGSTPGRTDAEDEKYTNMEINSIKTQLMVLPDKTRVYPGHGYETTIGHERKHNEWLE